MGILFILIIVSLIVAGCFLGAFLWAVRSGQFDDIYTPGIRVLFDDKSPDKNQNKKLNNNIKQTQNDSD